MHVHDRIRAALHPLRVYAQVRLALDILDEAPAPAAQPAPRQTAENPMNLDHYQHLALRTDLSRELPANTRILYHTAKIVEEVHEVLGAARCGQWALVREERGDVMWHLVCLADARGLKASDAIVDVIPTMDAVPYALELLAVTAKEIGQGKRPSMSVEGSISALWHWAVGDESWMILAASNIAKLEARYGGK